MELDVLLDKESISIAIDNPFHLDLDSTISRIDQFLASRGAALNGTDLRGLLPRMVKGIAGCEAGCPANAKDLVSAGYRNFTLQYIEGGILSASAKLENGKTLTLKLFPEF